MALLMALLASVVPCSPWSLPSRWVLLTTGLQGLLGSCSGTDLLLGDAHRRGRACHIAAFTWQRWMGQQGLP